MPKLTKDHDRIIVFRHSVKKFTFDIQIKVFKLAVLVSIKLSYIQIQWIMKGAGFLAGGCTHDILDKQFKPKYKLKLPKHNWFVRVHVDMNHISIRVFITLF